MKKSPISTKSVKVVEGITRIPGKSIPNIADFRETPSNKYDPRAVGAMDAHDLFSVFTGSIIKDRKLFTR